MTLISAYIELFIRAKSPGGNVRGKCPDIVNEETSKITLYYVNNNILFS